MPRDLIDIIGLAHRNGGVFVRLSDLVSQLGMDDALLAAVGEITDQIKRARLEILPSLAEGGLETERFLRPMESSEEVAVSLGKELAAGEGPSIEFKSSLLFDRARFAAKPETPVGELRSDKVLFAALKTICGFLNCGGGVLVVGVHDDASVVGIEDDFRYTGAGADATVPQHRDKWEQLLRGTIRERFHEGGRLNDLIAISLIECPRLTVARLKVGRARRLAAVRLQGSLEAYLRRGVRTDRLEPYEIEDVIRERIEQDDEPARKTAGADAASGRSA